MAKAKDQTREGVAAKPADFGRASDVAPEAAGLPLHPLMAHPAAALAAMTAVGFGLATQMASAFLGSLQGALEATEKLARKVDDEKVRDERPARPSEPAEATAKTATRKPAAKVRRAAKVPVAKAPVAKAAPAKPVKATPIVAAPVASKAATPKPAKAVSKGRGKADDLKKISGVGPKLEQILNGMGITRFADIAGWSDEDVARIDTEIGLGGRIVRDGWVARAKALKEGGA